MGKRLLTIYIIFIFASLISSLSKCPFPGYGTSCAILTIFGTIGCDSRSHGVRFIIFIVAVCLFVCLSVKIKGKRLFTIYIIFIFASLISSLSKCPFPGYGTSCAILTIFGTIGCDSRSHGVRFIIFIAAVVQI